MNLLYITSDKPQAGKTVLALSFLARLSEEGKRVGYFKPLLTGLGSDKDADFAQQMASDSDLSRPTLATTLKDIPGADTVEVADQVKTAVDTLMGKYDILVIEGPSLSSPQGDLSDLSIQIVQNLNAGVLVAVNYSSDMDPDDVTQRTNVFGDKLLGIIVNSVTRYRSRGIRQAFEEVSKSRGVAFLGAVPEDRVMLSVSLGQIAECLKGEWIMGQDKSNVLIESFLIGGNIMDPGETYFGRSETKAVVVRGDRPDIQLAALATPTRGLILTGGHKPVEYVYHEVQQQEIPTITVPSDTMATAESLKVVLQQSNPYHMEKVLRFRYLLDRHCNLQVVEESLA